jgi:hypothetical protein
MLGAAMGILKDLLRKDSSPRPAGQRGEATVRKQTDTGTSVITVAIRLEDLAGRRSFMGTKLEQPAVVELADELVQFYKRTKFSRTRRNIIYVAFDGYAIDGAAQACRHLEGAARVHLSNEVGIVFTKFEGVHLSSGWGAGVEIAVALACFRALGDPSQSRKLEMGGWEAI